jgi:competence protein ComEA
MKIIRGQVRNWFGFSRRERRSSFILLIIVVVIIAIRYIVPETNMAIEDIMVRFPGQDCSVVSDSEGQLLSIKPFRFDPNTVSFDSLILLGFEVKEANTLISYRNKGGRFRQADDIKKVYGLDKVKAERLIPFIELYKHNIDHARSSLTQQQRPLLEINSCDSSMLVPLPGIGPVLSVRIIKFRHLLGGFASIEQMKEVYGLSEETFELIKNRLEVDTLLLKKIKINFADYGELASHPYFDKYEVTAILKYRELNGIVKSLDDLIEENLITHEKANKIGPYLSFEY